MNFLDTSTISAQTVKPMPAPCTSLLSNDKVFKNSKGCGNSMYTYTVCVCSVIIALDGSAGLAAFPDLWPHQLLYRWYWFAIASKPISVLALNCRIAGNFGLHVDRILTFLPLDLCLTCLPVPLKKFAAMLQSGVVVRYLKFCSPTLKGPSSMTFQSWVQGLLCTLDGLHKDQQLRPGPYQIMGVQ